MVSLQPHIDAGRKLAARLEQYPSNISIVPLEERITWPSVSAWFSAAGEAIAARAGKRSRLMKEWQQLQESIWQDYQSQHRSDSASANEADRLVEPILLSVGLLEKVEHMAKAGVVSWNAASMWERCMATAAFLVGVVFLSILLWRGMNSEPILDRQFTLLRTVLALSSAAFVAALPGFITVEAVVKRFTIRAAGAAAVFVLVYFMLPAI